MNQSALYSPDLGECFTYSERMRTTHRKFSTGFWSQSLHQKLAQSGKFGRASETWISKNPLESHFSFNKKCFVGRTVMNQSALYFPDLEECFTYSKRIRTTHRKFSTGFWSQSLHQKTAQHDRIFWSLAELQRLDFQKIHLKVTFPSIKNVSCVVRSWIKMRYISLI